MFNDFKVDIYNKAPGTKANGIFIPGALTYVKSIDVDIQPYSRALLLKNYGYDIEVNKKIYLDCFDENIKIGTILKYTDQYKKEVNFEVKAIPWDDGYMEVMVFGL